jgi:hypothetical protein
MLTMHPVHLRDVRCSGNLAIWPACESATSERHIFHQPRCETTTSIHKPFG